LGELNELRKADARKEKTMWEIKGF